MIRNRLRTRETALPKPPVVAMGASNRLYHIK